MAFKGPLQSYGTNSHFEIRHSDCYPSKSAVIGFIAAASGIHREEVERLKTLQSIHFAVRIDQIGRLVKDYQTATKFKKNGDFDRNYVTSRYYIEDAAFLVAVEGEDQLITSVYESLSHPYFPLFLGRRSCPVNNDFLRGIYEGGAWEQLQQQPWIAAEWYQRSKSKPFVRLDAYVDKSCIPEPVVGSLRRDEPKSYSQLGRKHSLRIEVHKSVEVDNIYYKEDAKETEHDVFAAL